MPYLYLIKHPVPFPSSEYGGIWVIAANSLDEANNIVFKQLSKYDIEEYPNLKDQKYLAEVIGLTSYYTNEIVASFVT